MSRCGSTAGTAAAASSPTYWPRTPTGCPVRRAKVTRQILQGQPANRPAPGTAVVTDKGLAGEEIEEFSAGPDRGLPLIRPARTDEKAPRPFLNWLRQRVEAIIWTLKNQLGLERHGGRVLAGLWARIMQRLLACTDPGS